MSPFKSLFILYLIISSFALTVSSNIQKEEKGKYQLIDIPDDVLGKMKKAGIDIGAGYLTNSIFGGIDKIITTIGNGIVYVSSALYSSLFETFGPNLAGIATVSTFIVVLVGTTYVVYRIVDYAFNYEKVGEFTSSENEKKLDKKYSWWQSYLSYLLIY